MKSKEIKIYTVTYQFLDFQLKYQNDIVVIAYTEFRQKKTLYYVTFKYQLNTLPI